MIKVFVTIRDILMYIGAFIGIFMIGYVRVSFSTRQQKTSIPLQYNEKEIKLRKTAIVILAITIILALIPTRYLQ
ncbi:MAG: hypothetical protein IJL85_06005 [Erysipelotrichaceae bacterium]|nr:hypothetical protein [Erysipelotrichaceae bacterium]